MRREGTTTDVGDCARARLILTYAHQSAVSLFDAFKTVRRARKEASNAGAAGTTTNEDQDLLRAILVMSGAGLDSCLKQLIRDALPKLLSLDEGVEKGLKEFVVGQLGTLEELTNRRRASFLAEVLVAERRRDRVIEEYVGALTGSSLQSAEEVFRTASALGVTPGKLAGTPAKLKEAFRARNKIIHELDVNFKHRNRNREPRTQSAMIEKANLLLDIGEQFCGSVEERLTP